jgi:hypothetical protein
MCKSYRFLSKKKSFFFLDQHLAIFEEDLCQLMKPMKELVFLDTHGEIHKEKVESYLLMVQRLFPSN